MPSKKSTDEKVLAQAPIIKEKPSNGVIAKNGKHSNGVTVAQAVTAPAVPAAEANITAKATKNAKAPAKAKTPAKKKAAPKKIATPKATAPVSPAAAQASFQLRFHTSYGQSIYIIGSIPELGEMDVNRAVPLNYLDNEHWSLQLDLAGIKAPFRYQYLLKQNDGTYEFDWGLKTFDPGAFNATHILVTDAWNFAGYFENVFYTEPFTKVLLHRHTFNSQAAPAVFSHRFAVKAPLLNEHEVVCMTGQGNQLGNWNTAAPILLNKKAGDDFWTAAIDLSTVGLIEYKYGVFNTATNTFVRFEEGENRYAPLASPNEQVSINDGFVVLPNNTWKGAGVAIPVFSLRSARSFGVGEFTDLKLLVDWAKRIGLKMVQILPINDTSATYTWADSYPYAAISAFALHPMFIDLEQMTDEKNRHLLDGFEEQRNTLNASASVDYCEVIKAKMEYIRRVYPVQSAATFKKKDFKAFYTANEHWLVPYAVFCYLKDEYGTSDFNQWPQYSQYSREAIDGLLEKGSASLEKIQLHFFIQYHLHLQLTAATEYAHANQIIVKGDIPIGVYRYGADAWQHAELFHIGVQAGAPPDDFAIKGQNWGFPTYNWERMKQDGFEWWRLRFEQMSYYFDAFRIDHILGFFRIWSIPLHAVEGIMGHFVPAVPVHINEFAERGIYFDYNRYCRPLITEHILYQVFGNRAGEVKEIFLKENGYESYVLRDGFKTQRQVEKYFADKEDDQLKEGLFDLISNVVLFEEEGSGGTRFHFRFGMEGTMSFRMLDGNTQHQLKQLYVNYFFERQDHHWKIEALHKLPGLKRSTNMLICGEDLGLVPHSVPDVMRQLGILSLEIQRMPKAVQKQFFHPADAPYLSVVTPSTHDMSTIRGWWEENRENTQVFFNRELNQPGEAPYYCEPWINKAIVLQHLYSPAMWSIFQLQDLLGMDGELRRSDPSEERINLPSNPKNYWNYRMHISLEDLAKADAFNTELSDYLKACGRN